MCIRDRTSPKWKNFRGSRIECKEKIRLNNVIWRTWHQQCASFGLFFSRRNVISICRCSKYQDTGLPIRLSARCSHCTRTKSFLDRLNVFLFSSDFQAPITHQSKQQIINNLKGEYLKWRLNSKTTLRRQDVDISVRGLCPSVSAVHASSTRSE